MIVALIIDGAVARYADTPDSDGLWLPVTDCLVRDDAGPPVVTLHDTGVTRAWGLLPADVLPAKIDAIKAEAQRRIYVIAPAWRQANLQAAMTRLLGRNAGLSRSEWSADDLAAAAAGEALFDQIDAIRKASNDIETAVIALAETPGTTAADVAAWDVNTGWPA